MKLQFTLSRGIWPLLVVAGFVGCGSMTRDHQAKVDAAVSQVRRIAADVPTRPNGTGPQQVELDEVDPWGTKIVIFYPEPSGLFCVRAPGPDREAFTADDIQSSGGSVLVGNKLAEPR